MEILCIYNKPSIYRNNFVFTFIFCFNFTKKSLYEPPYIKQNTIDILVLKKKKCLFKKLVSIKYFF